MRLPGFSLLSLPSVSRRASLLSKLRGGQVDRWESQVPGGSSDHMDETDCLSQAGGELWLLTVASRASLPMHMPRREMANRHSCPLTPSFPLLFSQLPFQNTTRKPLAHSPSWC